MPVFTPLGTWLLVLCALLALPLLHSDIAEKEKITVSEEEIKSQLDMLIAQVSDIAAFLLMEVM